MARYEMVQPNGAYVTIDTYEESASAYTKEDFQKNPELRGLVQASIYIHFWILFLSLSKGNYKNFVLG